MVDRGFDLRYHQTVWNWYFLLYFIMILLSIYIYNWIGNKFLRLTSPSTYKYINSINKTNQMTANVQAISIIISKLSKINHGIRCFSAKHVTFRSKSKEWLARNQDNVYERSDMSIHRLLFQSASTMQIQLSVLVKYKADFIISLKSNMFSPWYTWKLMSWL